MNKFEDYILSALKQLGGEKQMLPGARVAATAIRLAANEGFDFKTTLRTSGQKFIDVVKQLTEAGSVRYISREGSDFLLGFPAAEIPAPGIRGTRIREDFYRAFSRARSIDAYYLPDKDEALFGEAPESATVIPAPTVDDVWAMRESFVNGMEPCEAKDKLLAYVRNSNRHFTEFAEMVRLGGLSSGWNQFQYNSLRQRIVEWAERNKLPIKDAWFSPAPTSLKRTGQRLGHESLLAMLTTEELSRVMIPADIVQSVLSRVSKR